MEAEDVTKNIRAFWLQISVNKRAELRIIFKPK